MIRPERLRSLFDFSTIPGEVCLHTDKVKLTYKGSTYEAAGEVLLLSTPSPRVVIRGDYEMPPSSACSLSLFGTNSSHAREEPELELGGHRITGSLGRRIAENARLSLDWLSDHEPIDLGDPEHQKLAYVLTHVFNFRSFQGPQHPGENVPLSCRLLLLDAHGWRVMLQALPSQETPDAWRRIKTEGLCLLTHIARLERRDGTPFSVEQVKDQIILLTQFLSLVSGYSNWPVCDVGFATNDERVWESFAAPRLGDAPFWWPDMNQGQQLEAFFPQFAARWSQSDAWRDCLKHAIYFYNQANTGTGQPGIDSGIVLVLAGLERLAYQFAVVERKMISSGAFKKVKLSDKLRLLFANVKIPLDIPADVSTIRALASRAKWIDGPHAITDIRNSLVHPEPKVSVRDCCFDAWKLSLWYLELAILALCGYQGTYQNRLNGGKVEGVPWMDNQG